MVKQLELLAVIYRVQQSEYFASNNTYVIVQQSEYFASNNTYVLVQ